MVLAAGQDQDVGIRAGRGGHRLQRLGDLEAPPAQVDRARRTPAPRDRDRPAGRRRRRSSRSRRPGRRSPCPVADLGHPLGLDHRPRRAEAATEHGQPGGGPAEPAEQGDQVTGPGAGPPHRPRPSRTPSAVTAIVMSRARVTSPPSRLTPAAAPPRRSPAAKSSAQPTGRSAGAEKPTSSPDARPPIASMSATLTATALRPTSRASDQSRRKCTPSTSTSTEVATGSSTGQHRGVVAGADAHVRRQRQVLR